MKMNKKVKFTVAVSMLVQAVSFVVVFFILAGKKKSLAKAFLAMAAVGGVAGTGLMISYLKDEKESLEFDDDFLFDEWDDCDCDECECFDCECDDESELLAAEDGTAEESSEN